MPALGWISENPEMKRTYQDHACIALTTGFMMGEGGVRARPDARPERRGRV